MVAWLAEDADLISIRPREPEDQRLFLTQTQQQTVAFVALAAAARPLRRARGLDLVAAAVKRPPFLGTWVAVPSCWPASAPTSTSWRCKREDTPGETRRRRSCALDKTKVEGLTVAAAGQDEVQLVREKDAWRMTAPPAVAADATEADAIVSTLESLELDEIVTESPSDAGRIRPGHAAGHGAGPAGGRAASRWR